jgi:hypothetical protein
MRHVRLDEMARAQRGIQTELACEDAGGDDARELTRVVARCGWVGAADAEEVEHGGLGLEDGAATDGANFDAGH